MRGLLNEVETYQATISLGLRERYTEKYNTIGQVIQICQKYCDDIGLCITVTPTRFIYTGGQENGCLIGLINYPRFPSAPEDIREKALNLARILKDQLNQLRVSVICSDKTYMIGK